MNRKDNLAAVPREVRAASRSTGDRSASMPLPFPGLDAPVILDSAAVLRNHSVEPAAVAEPVQESAQRVIEELPPTVQTNIEELSPTAQTDIEELPPAASPLIRRIDLYISRTGPLAFPERGDYRVVLQLSIGSSIRQSSILIPYGKAPASWESWSRWFKPFLGIRADEAMSVLYYDAEWVSDHRDRLLRKTIEPSTREETLFPATSFWRRDALIESSDIHIRLS